MMRRSLVSLVVVGSLTLLFAGCDGDSSKPATPTPGRVAAPTSTASPTVAASPTAEPFRGGRTQIEGSLGTGLVAALVDVRTADQGAFDRITFEFDAAGPNYRIEYVTSPSQCGSGEPIALAPGQAALQVKFMPAVAHNEAGQPTFGRNVLTPALPSIAKVVQECDFEADVTWIVILGQPLDFRVTALTNPARLAVDIAHP